MNFTVPPFVTYLMALGALVTLIWLLFDKAEEALLASKKDEISSWLKNLDFFEHVKGLPEKFSSVFDAIFGDRHFSWYCFYRSCLASLASVIVMIFIWSAIRPSQLETYLQREAFFTGWHFILVLLLSIIYNFLPNYVSLLETRKLLQWMIGTRSLWLLLIFLLLDLILTWTIGLAAQVITANVGVALIMKKPPLLFIALLRSITDFSQIPDILKHFGYILDSSLQLSAKPSGFIPMGIFFYSTFLTSLWLWLFVLSSLIVRIAGRLNTGMKWFTETFDVESKPLRSIGIVAIAITVIIFILLIFLR